MQNKINFYRSKTTAKTIYRGTNAPEDKKITRKRHATRNPKIHKFRNLWIDSKTESTAFALSDLLRPVLSET